MSETQDSPSSFRGVAIGCLGFLGGGFLLFVFFIDLMVGGAQLSRTGFYLAFGFIAHCQRLSLSPVAIGSLVAGVVLAGILIHFGLPRLLRKRQKDLTWSLGRSLGFMLLCCGGFAAIGGGAFALGHLPIRENLVVRVSMLKDDNYWYEAASMIEEAKKIRPLPSDGLAPGDPLVQEILTRVNDRELQEVFECQFRLAPSGNINAILLRIPNKKIAGGWEISLVTGEMTHLRPIVWPGDAR